MRLFARLFAQHNDYLLLTKLAQNSHIFDRRENFFKYSNYTRVFVKYFDIIFLDFEPYDFSLLHQVFNSLSSSFLRTQCFQTMQITTGAPINGVTALRGKTPCEPGKVHIHWHNKAITAPMSMVRGSRVRWFSVPTSKRAMCGTASPINATGPQ